LVIRLGATKHNGAPGAGFSVSRQQAGRPFRNGDTGKVKIICGRVLREDAGVLTFEWILLITLLVLGIIGGLTAVRDAVVDELGDVAGAVVNFDQSYTVVAPSCPLGEHLGSSFGFQDSPPTSGSTTGVVRMRSELQGQGDFDEPN